MRRTDGGDDVAQVHYEQLRGCAIAGRTWGVRHGLAVLLQQGMAAWMELCSLPRPPSAPARASVAGVEPISCAERFNAVVDILTHMTLSHLMETPV